MDPRDAGRRLSPATVPPAMFIELSEYLRCPQGHDERLPCIVVPEVMDGRRVVRGTIGCPLCRREYPIHDGEADFGGAKLLTAPSMDAEALPEVDVVRALLGLAGPGGYVVLLGTAARLAEPLAERMEGVHFVGVNVPPTIHASSQLSLVRNADGVPLASSMARGVVVGQDMLDTRWLAEATRITLRGLRIVVLDEGARVPDTEPLAADDGLWVGKKR